MLFTTQYYRPPFPEPERWREDLAEIARTGFDAVWVSAPWAWIEPAPGEMEFADFDRFFELAGANGLGVIVNLWSEMHPMWIHREIPDSRMVDHLGREVVSSQLAYMNFGLSPGGCTDNPRVADLAARFATAFAARYADAPALLAWDAWNEMRWLSQADGFVCYCDHTLAAFRDWLRQRFTTLDALNAAWHRRYRVWEDVQPVKSPTRTYTDGLAWQAFLADRVRRVLRRRVLALREVDSEHPVLAHAAFPSTFATGEYFEWEQPLARGVDWDLAEEVDGYGASHFPAWMSRLPSEYGARLESARCATGTKTYWVSELQGGAGGHGMQALEPVDARQQSRWVWNAVARGAKGINFWCWRDEVFGRESSGFGIVGDDGQRDERLVELAAAADALRRNGELLDAYRPNQVQIAVVFESRTYALDWSATLGAGFDVGPQRFQPGHSLQGYLLALERLQLPYDVVEPGHLGDLSPYKLVVLPWPLIVDSVLADQLASWVDAGGTLVVESWLDAFDTEGLFRYPGERPFATALGIHGGKRAPLDGSRIRFNVGDVTGELRSAIWSEPLVDGEAFATYARGDGRVIAVGTFAGLAYREERYEDFEQFVIAAATGARALPSIACDLRDGEVVHWRTGNANGRRVLFVVNEGPAVTVTFRGELSVGGVRELIADEHAGSSDGETLTVELKSGRSHLFAFGVE
jgi:beta-galactosidase